MCPASTVLLRSNRAKERASECTLLAKTVGHRVFDAAYEEVLHLITHAGYAFAYPEVFGERPGTKLGDAMDKARGGRFLAIPNKYPKKAWYTYYDDTRDYGCQATEYNYW